MTTYNSDKLEKYSFLIHMVCEATIRYISNKEIYAAEGKKLDEIIFLFWNQVIICGIMSKRTIITTYPQEITWFREKL
jgi:hypothetical protein